MDTTKDLDILDTTQPLHDLLAGELIFEYIIHVCMYVATYMYKQCCGPTVSH